MDTSEWRLDLINVGPNAAGALATRYQEPVVFRRRTEVSPRIFLDVKVGQRFTAKWLAVYLPAAHRKKCASSHGRIRVVREFPKRMLGHWMVGVVRLHHRTHIEAVVRHRHEIERALELIRLAERMFERPTRSRDGFYDCLLSHRRDSCTRIMCSSIPEIRPADARSLSRIKRILSAFENLRAGSNIPGTFGLTSKKSLKESLIGGVSN